MLDRLCACELVVYVSSAVDANLISSGFDLTLIRNYRVIDVRGLEALRRGVSDNFYGFDLVFTIFGPMYLPRSIRNHVVGFAQSWIIYPKNDVSLRLPLKERLRLRLKFIVQWWFFRTSSQLIVEAKHVRDGLIKEKYFPGDRIDVVSNCVSAIYYEPARWEPVLGLNGGPPGVVKIGYVSRAYIHKNIDFLVDVARELRLVGGVEYQFFVTLNSDEWEARSDEFRRNIFNVGPLNVAQCPSFYKSMDAVFFPSLLESFSATPLEAMLMRRPLFASDRDFVRDCCGVNALYFDPLDPSAAAKKIADWFCKADDDVRESHLERAYRHVMSRPGSRDRACSYIDIINAKMNS